MFSLGIGLILDILEGVCSATVDTEVDGGVNVEVVAGATKHAVIASDVIFGRSVVVVVIVAVAPDGKVAVDI